MGGTNERLKMKMTMSLPRKENQNLFSAFCSTMSIVIVVMVWGINKILIKYIEGI